MTLPGPLLVVVTGIAPEALSTNHAARPIQPDSASILAVDDEAQR
ncbi:hypothetical protein [Afipia sp. DC4300-2b1]